MGQYYKFINITKREKLDKNQVPMKLTEHSYVGNVYCNQALNLLCDRWAGDEVIHVGDYAQGSDGTNTQDYIKQLEKKFNLKEPVYFWSDHFNEPDSTEKSNVRYVYNLDKKKYIDLYRQPAEWIYLYDNKIGCTKFNSFALLIGCGNGLGGGDYWCVNKDCIGLWAGDHFIASDKKMDKFNDFELFDIVFIERSTNKDSNIFYDGCTYDDIKKLEYKSIPKRLDEVVNSCNLKSNDFKKLKLNDFNFLSDEKKIYSDALNSIKNKNEQVR